MTQTNNNQDFEDVKRDLQLQGRKIALLLYESPMPAEIKEAWITLMPTMTLDQIDRFGTILENYFVMQQTAEIDAAYRALAEEIAAAAQNLELENEEKLLEQIEIVKKLESL